MENNSYLLVIGGLLLVYLFNVFISLKNMKKGKINETVLKEMNVGIMTTDHENRIAEINPPILEFFNVERNEIVGQPVNAFINDWNSIKDRFRDNSDKTGETELKSFDSKYYFSIDIYPLNPGKEKSPERIIVLKSNNERKTLLDEIEEIKKTDTLTETYTRKYFFDRAAFEFERSRRYKREMSLLLIGVDSFKRINEGYGMRGGDYVLREIASILKGTLRDVDIVARFTSTEFAVILPETNKDNSGITAERLLKLVNKKSFSWEGKEMRVSISLGVASFVNQEDYTLNGMISQAEFALNNALIKGGNQMFLFEKTT